MSDDFFACFFEPAKEQEKPLEKKKKSRSRKKEKEPVRLVETSELLEKKLLPMAPPENDPPPGPHASVKRKNPAPYSVQKFAEEYSQEAIMKLVYLMRFSEGDGDQREAARLLLERAHGKPAVQIKAETTVTHSMADLEKKVLTSLEEINERMRLAAQQQAVKFDEYIDAEVTEK